MTGGTSSSDKLGQVTTVLPPAIIGVKDLVGNDQEYTETGYSSWRLSKGSLHSRGPVTDMCSLTLTPGLSVRVKVLAGND
jgi:hypothetical protein